MGLGTRLGVRVRGYWEGNWEWPEDEWDKIIGSFLGTSDKKACFIPFFYFAA